MTKLFRALLPVSILVLASCSTTGHFKLPSGTKLEVTDRDAMPDGNGEWKTSPFFWNSTAGANYKLTDSSGNTIRSGKLKTHFRVVSIFWPPFALIYWPMGLVNETYDLTQPADGVLVKDNGGESGAAPEKKMSRKERKEMKKKEKEKEKSGT